MIRLVASCVWVCGLALASVYVTVNWRLNAGAPRPAVQSVEHLTRRQTQPVSVPMIVGGTISGYIVAQFAYLVDQEALKGLSVPPDAFITDEAFRRLYVDKIDFDHLEKFDISSLTKDLLARVNQRLGADIVRDVLVEQFNYVARNDVSK